MNDNKFDTDIGKIYCTYNESNDEFEKIRVREINNNKIIISHLDENCHMIVDKSESYDANEFKKIKEKCVLLKSEGFVSISNIISTSIGNTKIPDVILVYFPNNKITTVPDFHQPYIIARQGIDNIFSAMSSIDVAGMSISIDTLPSGWALSDFMANESVKSTKMCQIYKTDTAQELSILLDNDDTQKSFTNMYEHALQKSTYLHGYNSKCLKKKDDDCIGGYCSSLKRFITESDFIGDIYDKIGIMKIDSALESNVPLNDDDKLLISTLGGGIRIEKAVPIKFDYDINMEVIKMNYILVKDIDDILWIVPYTVSKDEFDSASVYNLTEESTIKLQDRLKKVVKAYDKSTNIKSGSPLEFDK